MSPWTVYLLLLSMTCVSSLMSQGCHPLCSYQCDNPVCPADCRPVCQPYNCRICEITEENTTICNERIEDGCSTNCPPDQCETDTCPQCEIKCSDDLCDDDPNCLIQCYQIECAWDCRKPYNCPKPVCELQCEQSACQLTSNGSSTHDSLKRYNGVFYIIIMIIILFF